MLAKALISPIGESGCAKLPTRAWLHAGKNVLCADADNLMLLFVRPDTCRSRNAQSRCMTSHTKRSDERLGGLQHPIFRGVGQVMCCQRRVHAPTIGVMKK